MATTKVLGWGKCSVNNHDDIVENSCQLSVEDGQEQEATIEGGSAEGYKRQPDKYVLTYNRRIGSASDVKCGFTESVEGEIVVTPEAKGAVGVKLTGCSLHTAVKFDSTDGLVAVYTYKTKGEADNEGNLTDINFFTKGDS